MADKMPTLNVTDYSQRLHIPLSGDPSFRFFTSTGLHLATGFTRVVIGARGPYVEFSDEQIILSSIFVPESQKHRLTSSTHYYAEWRSKDSANVKFYHQKATVDYADYRVEMWYASPFELFDESKSVLIAPIKKPSVPTLFDL